MITTARNDRNCVFRLEMYARHVNVSMIDLISNNRYIMKCDCKKNMIEVQHTAEPDESSLNIHRLHFGYRQGRSSGAGIITVAGGMGCGVRCSMRIPFFVCGLHV